MRRVAALVMALAGATAGPAASAQEASRWCDALPRPANAALERVSVPGGWFEVYRPAEGVYAIAEPRQAQEVISYLVVGRERALLFDTGLGLAPIRPVVEALTRLPVQVLNSHTHFDHVGGNAEFAAILAVDTPYTRANSRGFPHSELAGEVAPESRCGGLPAGADAAAFHTRPWRASGRLTDGQRLDLGGRVLEVLRVPGHTPDAVALLDRANGLLFTGDTYYDGPIWLYVPETSLDDYERSIARLAALAPTLRRLLPAHNAAVADPARLGQVSDAIRRVRSGTMAGREESGGRVEFLFDGFSILTAKALLAGRRVDPARGGSGLAAWPEH